MELVARAPDRWQLLSMESDQESGPRQALCSEGSKKPRDMGTPP